MKKNIFWMTVLMALLCLLILYEDDEERQIKNLRRKYIKVPVFEIRD